MLNVFFFSGNGLYNEIKYNYEIRPQNYSLQQKVWDRKVMFCKLSILWSKWPWLAYQPQGPGSPGVMMSSEEYSRIMNFALKRIAKKNNLMITHYCQRFELHKNTGLFLWPQDEIALLPWKVTRFKSHWALFGICQEEVGEEPNQDLEGAEVASRKDLEQSQRQLPSRPLHLYEPEDEDSAEERWWSKEILMNESRAFAIWN